MDPFDSSAPHLVASGRFRLRRARPHPHRPEALAAPELARPEPQRAVMVLWPGSAPGSSGLQLTETITERSADPKRPDRFVAGVLRPSLTVFAPAHPNGVGIIIASGGGYVREVLDKESSEIAAWVAARGVTAFVLKHRLPGEGHAARADVPLQDAQSRWTRS